MPAIVLHLALLGVFSTMSVIAATPAQSRAPFCQAWANLSTRIQDGVISFRLGKNRSPEKIAAIQRANALALGPEGELVREFLRELGEGPQVDEWLREQRRLKEPDRIRLVKLDILLRDPTLTVADALAYTGAGTKKFSRKLNDSYYSQREVLEALGRYIDFSANERNALNLAAVLPTKTSRERILRDLGEFPEESIRWLLGDNHEGAFSPVSDIAALAARLHPDTGNGFAVADTSSWLPAGYPERIRDIIVAKKPNADLDAKELRDAEFMSVDGKFRVAVDHPNSSRDDYSAWKGEKGKDPSNEEIVDAFINRLGKALNDKSVDLELLRQFLLRSDQQQQQIMPKGETGNRIVRLGMYISWDNPGDSPHPDFSAFTRVVTWGSITKILDPLNTKVLGTYPEGATATFNGLERFRSAGLSRRGPKGPQSFPLAPVLHAGEIATPKTPRLVLVMFYDTPRFQR